jgi:hypothetical protein
MGAPYLFGQNLTFEFYPLAYDSSLSSAQLLNISLVNAYVFTDIAKPVSVAASQAGTGASQGPITSWTAGNGGFSFSISSINDPSPELYLSRYIYWVAVNFRLDTGAQIQTVLAPLELWRVDASFTRIGTDDATLEQFFPSIDSLYTQAQQLAAISAATLAIKSRIKAQGFDWARIYRLDRLNLIVAYKALVILFIGQTTGSGSRFPDLVEYYTGELEAALKSLTMEYEDDSRAPEVVKQPNAFKVLFR